MAWVDAMASLQDRGALSDMSFRHGSQGAGHEILQAVHSSKVLKCCPARDEKLQVFLPA
jgi:hypothetical protein